MTINNQDKNFYLHLSNDDLLKYNRHLLSDDETIRIESHLQNCILCKDALKGVSEMNDAMHVYAVTRELRKRMIKRKIIRRTIFSRFELITILLVFFILGLILFLAYYFLMTK